MSAQTAGLALFGSDISREGDIELIALGTAQAIYVFNAHNRDLVNKVVKPLLESTRLQKVMYGLRHESDALHHLLGISLEHAFDIRLMYHMVEKKMFTDGVIGRRNVDQLVPYERVVLKFFNLKLPSLDLQMNYRDMSVRVKNVIRLKTIFLRDLFALIHNLMLEEFYNVNRRCLHSLRASEGLEYLVMRADDRELELIENEPTEWELQQIPVLAIPEMMPSTSDTPKTKLVNNGYTILKTKENNNSDETLNSVESR